MKSKLVAVLAILSIVTLGFSSLVQAKQITDNSYRDSSPHIKGNYLTWQGRVDGDWEVFLYDIATGETIQITNNSYGDISPKTDGSCVVWLGFSRSGGEIFLYDISSQETTQITDDSNVDSRPEIANGLVVWASQEVTDSVGPGEIFLYRTATLPETEPEQLTDNTDDDSSPRINDQHVIWVQEHGSGATLCLYDLPDGPPYEAPQGYIWKDSPQTDGDLTVYSRVVGNDREIFVHDTSPGIYKQITENDLQDKSPRISGNNIVWVGGEAKTSEIFLASYLVIDRVRPRPCERGDIVRIEGYSFGDTQGDSVVHWGATKVYGPGHQKIKLWTDTKIKVKVPSYNCSYWEGKEIYKKKVWVTVDGLDSNKRTARILKPDTCP